MISSFFSKAKPIHLLVVCPFLLLVFVTTKFFALKEALDIFLIVKQTGLFLCCIASVFVLDFLVSKNNLTQKNSYKILFFVLFISLLPETILNSKIVLANLFILLALRRIISLRSQKEIKKKIFDASFWISLATLLYFWASLFYVLIFAALILYAITGIKNWIVPLVGVLTVLIICVSYLIIRDLDFLNYFNALFFFSFDFTQLNSRRVIIGVTLILSYGLWSLFYFIKHLKDKSRNHRSSFVLIIITAFLAMTIVIVAPDKSGSEFMFLLAPLAIIVTNYLEVISEKWFKEVLIWVLILMSIILPFID